MIDKAPVRTGVSILVMLAGIVLHAEEDLSSSGWRLWLDRDATWMDDTLYTPDEIVAVEDLPNNPPTGGWGVLSNDAGIVVKLPGTVEEHYWEQMLRPFIHDQENSGYTEVVNNEGDNRCGAYRGVSWWWRKFDAPPLKNGQRLVINFRAARYRAEVFLNEQLVGYNILPQVPFSVDVTDAMKNGENTLALRITSPGGNFDWYDWIGSVWGSKKNPIPLSHGFGGLDAGIEMLVRDDVYIEDLAVLNRQEINDIRIITEIKCVSQLASGKVKYTIKDKHGKTVWTGKKKFSVEPGTVKILHEDVTVKNIETWDLDTPNLYTIHAEIKGGDDSDFNRTFGFRTVVLEGVGSDAMLRVNGKRVVLKSMISWGYWAVNGLLPDKELARKEVAAAKALGLNCINAHRNIGKPLVLEEMDRQGLFMFEEPGAGAGAYGDNKNLLARIEQQLILRMVKRDRSHPSLFMYNLCNEQNATPGHPSSKAMLAKVKELDPSRIWTSISGVNLNPPHLNSGLDKKFERSQSMMRPWDDTPFYMGNGNDPAGWYDEHTVNGAGVWLDTIYKNPGDFWHKAREKKNIQAWGEMAGFGSPDNHAAMIRYFDETGRPGYSRRDSRILDNAYNAFLDKYKFRDAFPTTESLYLSAGDKAYSSWAKVMTVARLSDENDVLIGNGWDSTLYDNHSGLVDGLRNFKGSDPNIMRRGMEPLMLAIMPRRFIVDKGGVSVVDVWLLNEKDLHGDFRLEVQALTPEGKLIRQESHQVSVKGGDRFSQLLVTGTEFVQPEQGIAKYIATLTKKGEQKPALTREEAIHVVDWKGAPIHKKVYVWEDGDEVRYGLNRLGVKLVERPEEADIIVFSSKSNGGFHGVSDAYRNATGFDRLLGYGQGAKLFEITDLANGPCDVELLFGENDPNSANHDQRMNFDINGKRLIDDMDVDKEAGGINRILTKRFNVDITDGRLTVAASAIDREEKMVRHGRGNNRSSEVKIQAVKVKDANGKQVAMWGGDRELKHRDGMVYREASPNPYKTARELSRLARERGKRLVFWPESSDVFGRLKGEVMHGLLREGHDGSKAEYPWMGGWYFAREHFLLEDLPVNCVFDWRHQAGTTYGLDYFYSDTGHGSARGFILDAEGLDVAVGLGADHQNNPGIVAGSLRAGEGDIVFVGFPQLVRATKSEGTAFNHWIALKILGNSIR
jgi:beta-galactosidase